MKKCLFFVMAVLCFCPSCNKEVVQSSYLKIGDEDVASFFVAREINTNHFIVVKGVYLEGDNIPHDEDAFLSFTIAEEQFNKTISLAADNQWSGIFMWGGVCCPLHLREDIDDKSTCQIVYNGGNRFDVQFQLYMNEADYLPSSIELFYAGEVILVDSNYKVVH